MDNRQDIRFWFGKPKEKQKSKNKNNYTPNYFYLESANDRAKWLYHFPKNSIELGSFRSIHPSQKGRPIILCCSRSYYEIIDTDKDFKIDKMHYPYKEFNLSILKSQLQKCTRRELDILGLSTAISMSLIIDENKKINQIGLFELLRRFTIIVIEDAILNIWYPNLVWYMSALSKGIKLGQKTIETIFKIINLTLVSLWRDNSYRHIKIRPNTNFAKTINSLGPIGTKKRYLNVLWSLYFRTSYNGMLNDTEMIYKSIIIWSERIKEKSNLCTFLDLDITINDKDIVFNPLDPEDILLEAIDFHCTNICNRVSEVVDYDITQLKELIWNFRSSVNNRMEIEPIKNKDLYKEPRNHNLWKSINNIVTLEALKIKLEKFDQKYKI